jgi:sporulation protein YlmC with PRC-barrel domain
MLKKLMMTTALSGLMATAAFAQAVDTKPIDSPAAKSPPAATAPASTTGSGSAQFINMQKPDQWLASKFKGTDVVGSDNEKIGDVSDILFDKAGKIEAFIVSVGGFLGMGAKDVAMAPAAFQVVTGDKSKNEDDKLKVAMTKEQLKQAANFEPYNPPRTTTGMGGGSPRPAPAAPAPR